jgi:murein DD-endopeptidase MepM/ murein hydrolase activator NlpD
VKRGDIIGFEGDSGRSTGPHLHYEVRIYNTPVNPWRYLSTAATATAAAD